MERLGVLGGSFDPPHWGHVHLAQAARAQLDLNRVLWVPAGRPPHKSRQTPAHHRAAMTRLAIAGHPGFSVCRLDVDRAGPHYTADLLELLRAQHPHPTQFWFVVGQDSLRDLGTWKQPDRILELSRLAVYPRPGAPIDWAVLESIVPDIRACIDWLHGSLMPEASRQIRRQVRLGESIDGLVPAGVQAYIQQHHLYQPRANPRQ